MATYKNTWYDHTKPIHSGNHPHGKQGGFNMPMIETDAQPVEYGGFLIYHRVNHVNKDANVFDVVKDGACIGQYAGINGAKRFIDGKVADITKEQAYIVNFHGRLNGALGITYDCIVEVSIPADTLEESLYETIRLKLYDTHEHIINGITFIKKV